MAELEFRLAIGDIEIAQARNDLLPLLTLEYAYATNGKQAAPAVLSRTPSAIPCRITACACRPRFRSGTRRPRPGIARRVWRKSAPDCHARNRSSASARRSTTRSTARTELAADSGREQGVVAEFRNYRVEQSQFQLGRRTSTEVLRAASDLAEAQSRRIEAFVSYEIAQILLAAPPARSSAATRSCSNPSPSKASDG